MTVGAAGKIRFAARKNSRVAYRINGAPGREPVVFLHDLLFTQSVFAAIETPGLVPDLRGHGASATLANQWYSLAELADDVAAILDAENAPSAHLVGHGLGGTIAFEFAKKHPGRSRSLTLIEPNLYAVLEKDLDRGARTLREERRTSDRAAGDAAYKQLVDKSLDGYLTPRFGADWRSRASKGRSGAIRRNAGALAGMLPALDSFTPSRGDIERVVSPTLLLLGADAAPVDQISVARLAGYLPNARIESFVFNDRLNDPFGKESARSLDQLAGSISAGL